MRIIDPGEFRHLIEIQRLISGEDKENRPKESWETVLRPRAKILKSSGEENVIAKGVSSKIVKTFCIRFPRNIKVTNADRVLYEGTPYNIIYPDNVEGRNIYLEIKTEYVD